MWKRVTLLGALLIGSWIPLAVAEKTDVVELINGNKVTGEIKSLVFGKLNYSTDSMGTVKIDWEDVVSVTSSQYLEVELTTGARVYGNLEESTPGSIAVGFGEGVDELRMADVIRILPIETDDKLINRLEGAISFGFNTGKASEVTQLNVNANVRYRDKKYLLGLTLNAAITDQKEKETSKRQSLGLNYQRFRNNRWFTDWFSDAEKNDELGINSRFLLGGGLGRYFVQNNKNQFSVLVGLVATRESFVASESSQTNAEGKIAISYRHRALEPDTDVIFTSDIFPLLEDLSSFRAETNLTFRKEFIEDLMFDVSIYHSYLSDPSDGAEKSDYGVVTSVGYSF